MHRWPAKHKNKKCDRSSLLQALTLTNQPPKTMGGNLGWMEHSAPRSIKQVAVCRDRFDAKTASSPPPLPPDCLGYSSSFCSLSLPASQALKQSNCYGVPFACLRHRNWTDCRSQNSFSGVSVLSESMEKEHLHFQIGSNPKYDSKGDA